MKHRALRRYKIAQLKAIPIPKVFIFDLLKETPALHCGDLLVSVEGYSAPLTYGCSEYVVFFDPALNTTISVLRKDVRKTFRWAVQHTLEKP